MKIRHIIAATLALVAILWFQGARADVLDDLKAEGVVKLYLDFRAGHLQDLSGNANHGTADAIGWSGDGVTFPTDSSRITVADSAELQLTEGSIIALIDFADQNPGEQRIVYKRDALNTNYDLHINSTMVIFGDGTNLRFLVHSVLGNRCLAVNFKDGETGEVFDNGLSVGALSGTSDISVDDAVLHIGNNWAANDPLLSPMRALMIINRKLTATEHAQLCAALQSYRFPKMPAARAQGSYGVELVTDGDMEAATTGAWTAGASATLSKQDGGALAGDQVLRVAYNGEANAYAYQTVFTIGDTYRITGAARGDGTHWPALYSDAFVWIGTTAATWQFFDFVHTATNTRERWMSVGSTAGKYVEFDNISVTEVESDHIQYKTEWGAKEALNFGGSKRLPGTDLWVNSGNMGITMQEINGTPIKAVTCAAGGGFELYAREIEGDPFEDAYGTFEFWFRKAAGTTFIAHIIADDLWGTNGYSFRVSATEIVTLVQNGTGNLFATTAAYVTADTWYQVRITRRQSDGMFTVYIDGVLVTADSGANPVAQNTVKASTYIVFDVGIGDHVGVSDVAGDHSLWKAQGVIAP